MSLKTMAVLFVLTVSNLFAQQWQWPEKPKNLKVLPPTTNAQQLRQNMLGYTNALGVRCVFCHVGEDGKPLETFDFVSDEKPTKGTARLMATMVKTVNENFLNKIDKGGAPAATVSCVTCHHGQSEPVLLEDLLKETVTQAGIDSAIRQYRQLRADYYGGFTYNFKESSLARLAGKLSSDKKFAEAAEALKLNLSFYPDHTRSLSELASAYKQLNKKPEAIQTLEKLLKLEPDDANAKKMLEELKK